MAVEFGVEYKEYLIGGTGSGEYWLEIKPDTVREEEEIHLIDVRAYNKMKDVNAELQRKLDMVLNILNEERDATKRQYFKLDKAINFMKRNFNFFANEKNYQWEEHPDGLEGRGDFPVTKNGIAIAKGVLREVDEILK